MRDNWQRRLRSKPLVLLDWGYIRALGNDAMHLSNRYNYLVPELALVEACTAERGSPTRFAHKLLRFLKQNQTRTYLASHLAHMLQAEPKPGVLADRLLIAHRPFFETEEDANSVNVEGLDARVKGLGGNDHPYTAIQREFEEGRATFAAGIRENDTGRGILARQTPEDLGSFIVRPETVTGWVSVFNHRYESRRWKAALMVFPDRHAAGRWWRVALWYWLREARGVGPKRLRNDWWDSIYVFTASYCDQFWTVDQEAAQLVGLLFKETKVVFQSPQGIGARH